MSHQISDVLREIENMAPIASQESWDNCGVQVGDISITCSGVIVSLDATEQVVEEAIRSKANLIISHHPLIFKGIKSITGKNYVERTLLLAIKNDITIYAAHTNFDVFRYGVNYEIGTRLGLSNMKILQPRENSLTKLSVFVATENALEVKQAMHNAGAGNIGNYANCSFETKGLGNWKPLDGSNPFIGVEEQISTISETKIEVIVSNSRLPKVISAMIEAHPYEQPAYDLVELKNVNEFEGLGMIGELKKAISSKELLKKVKETFGGGIRFTGNTEKLIKTIAVCGGTGISLMNNAIRLKTDCYITSDVKYHEFFDAENQLFLVDIGHFEGEQFTSNRIVSILTEKFPNFAVRLTEVITNPINYF